MTDPFRARYGVLGWPVGHSRSPQMMRAAGLLRYQHLPVAPEVFAETVRGLPALGFAGVNVTIPHKEAALDLADECSDAARAIGAANTLVFRPDATILALNTDAPGFLSALGTSARQTAVVLGAGGSARAVIWALRAAGAEVWVVNRTVARAESVASEFGAAAATEVPSSADLLVNCTSVGLGDNLTPLSLTPPSVGARPPYATVVDLVYGAGETELLRQARATGAVTVDGREILVAQGAASFQAWTGEIAPLAAMRRAVVA